ncbi:hypothetical protein PENSPDRAFT_736295 [Peniophora sp. CONT]|nr:hypothetical protein PENSPDRAFT_736295 [Peniophora sp. CONT]
MTSQAGALARLSLTFCELYIYDFAMSVPFDVKLVMRDDSQRSFLARGVKWVYIASRYSCLSTCLTLAINMTAHSSLNCAAVIKTINATSLFALNCAELLLLVRVGVVWKWDRKLITSFAVAYVAIIAMSVRSVVLIQAYPAHDPLGLVCDSSGIKANRSNVLATLILNAGLLLGLLFGLKRWSQAGGSSIWHLLWNQSLLYLSTAVAVELPMTILLFLDFDEVMSSFFDPPLQWKPSSSNLRVDVTGPDRSRRVPVGRDQDPHHTTYPAGNLMHHPRRHRRALYHVHVAPILLTQTRMLSYSPVAVVSSAVRVRRSRVLCLRLVGRSEALFSKSRLVLPLVLGAEFASVSQYSFSNIHLSCEPLVIGFRALVGRKLCLSTFVAR